VKNKFAFIAMASILCATAFSAFADVVVTEPWVRGVVKGQTETIAYMTLKTTEATSLIAAASPVAKTVQIHVMKMQGNMMKMRPVKALHILANTPFELKPEGDYHVMLIGLVKPLAKGDMVPIKLTFSSKGGAKRIVDIQAEVRNLAESTAPKEMDHMNMKH